MDDAWATFELSFDGDLALVTAEGEVDVAVSQELEDLLMTLVADARLIRVDASRMTFLDCSGLNALLRASSSVRERGGDLHIVEPTRAVRRLLELAGLT